MEEQLFRIYRNVFELALLEEIQKIGIYKKIQAGAKLIDIGSYITAMPMLMTGIVKVLREDTDGNELLLYYLKGGDTCSMTMTCCVGQQKSEVRAIAEIDTEVIMIPVAKMEEWAGKYKTWRNFVFNSYNNRLNELFETIDNIAFKKMDERLLKYLIEKKKLTNSNLLYTTHQNIADDMHTSRVVISRLLKKLEQLGNVKLHRNHIEVFH